MKLYLVHVGFYDLELCDGIYESHANYFVVAEDFESARAKAKAMPEFKKRKMHVDGLQEIDVVDGHAIMPVLDTKYEGVTRVVSHRHRDLAPKPAT